MINRILQVLMVLILWTFSSCSRMIVTVSAADLEIVDQEAERIRNRTDAYYYASVRTMFFSNSLFDEVKLKADFESFLEKNKDNPKLAKTDKDDFQRAFEKNLNKKIQEIKDTYSNGILKTKSKEYDKAVDSFLMAIVKSEHLANLISIEFDGFKDLDKTFYDKIDLLKKVIQSAPERNRDNLLGDPMVSYITKDDNLEIWKSNYNKTKSWTSFGNSDIAVVMTEDPESYNNNYTIKGVRVDADKLIQSSFDALAQSINVLASSQGVAVADDTVNNYFAPSVTPAIQKLPEEESKLRSHQKVLEEYRKFILLEILGRNLDNKSGDELNKSIEEIQTVWNNYKTSMENQINK